MWGLSGSMGPAAYFSILRVIDEEGQKRSVCGFLVLVCWTGMAYLSRWGLVHSLLFPPRSGNKSKVKINFIRKFHRQGVGI